MAAIPVRLFHRNDLHARLWCLGQGCWFDVEAQAEGPDPLDSLRLEVFLQPRSAAGWPVGLPRLLFEETVPWPTNGEERGRFARLQLPYRLTPALLETCHFRLIPVTTENR